MYNAESYFYEDIIVNVCILLHYTKRKDIISRRLFMTDNKKRIEQIIQIEEVKNRHFSHRWKNVGLVPVEAQTSANVRKKKTSVQG